MASIPTTDALTAADGATGEPPAKKLKASSTSVPQPPAAGVSGGHHLEAGIVSGTVMAAAPSLAEQYQSAAPYNHCVMRDIFNADLLRQVRDEIINNINATYKETDLFKVFQTGDLGNLDSLDPEAAAKLPGLMKLKKALYSDEFRAFVTTVTGCGELSPRTDCSCNVYAYGGHLLCHDDVIANRRVSYIIYLTDPDDPWVPEDGGALELYPLVEGQEHTPAPAPTLSHLPFFNTMAMFTVTPGRSFHAVQEVFSGEKPRLSISGWYHADQPPQGADKASLKQLQMRAGEDAQTRHETIEGGAGPLSDDDLALLIRYVNPVYLSESSWPKIRERFAAEGSVQLHNFLKRGLAEQIVAACISEDGADGLGNKQIPRYTAGVRDGWVAVGPPHKQRYLKYDNGSSSRAGADGANSNGAADAAASALSPSPPSSPTAGSLLDRVRRDLLASGSFARLLKALTSVTMLGQTGELTDTGPGRAGLDYTVAHYGILTTDPRLDVVLTFVDDSTDEAASAWQHQYRDAQAGEVGGFEAYLLADEEGEDGGGAAEVYRVNADSEESGVLNVNAAANTLNLVLRDEGLMRFVKYVSFAAPGSRWDVVMEYLPEDDDDDDEGGMEGQGVKAGGEEMEEAGGEGRAEGEPEVVRMLTAVEVVVEVVLVVMMIVLWESTLCKVLGSQCIISCFCSRLG
ncbi:hypothetical protein VOLCADRAFT_108132 [Volvox carteri f. nagariensis]|uniref:Fe2OG dioxygenase domain-containing protein n=1 Tax=Volvox carteri f. nagariensis TaxID=3068 RepID=D8UIG4_VOLCA|nr:uncharacterized protein VOLCADRAFT_108132 [Volvox carteri f. nagariensis]EFJ40470.1 hypothetical protein VOLCADRAFT_108132 [Volvox carteri f. nagariensis]|eukprot:XP_002958470.1 hypothetical protein VOLCADRAFT_108132 [Volvox carteri f. nagariensis]